VFIALLVPLQISAANRLIGEVSTITEKALLQIPRLRLGNVVTDISCCCLVIIQTNMRKVADTRRTKWDQKQTKTPIKDI